MHPPRFFIGLLAVSVVSVMRGVTAAPVSATSAVNMPGFYQPNSVAENISNVSSAKFAPEKPFTLQDATEMVQQHLVAEMGMKPNDFKVTNSYHSKLSGLNHVYAVQMFEGLPIANAVSNFNIDSSSTSGGAVMASAHQSFVSQQKLAKAVPVHKRDAPVIPADQAVLNFAKAKGLKVTDKLTVKKNEKGVGFLVTGASFAMGPIQATEKYYQTATDLVHTWDLNVNMEDAWMNAFVDSATGKVVGLANWTSNHSATGAQKKKKKKAKKVQKKPAAPAPPVPAPAPAPAPQPDAGPIQPATYNVVPIGKTDPIQNNNGLTSVTSPWDLKASPNGWHNVGATANTDLSGNNVLAQSNPNNLQDPNDLAALPRPVSANLQFQFQFDPAQAPTNPVNRDAATTNLFYVANSMHDIFYNYGFTEAAGNFQIVNNGKGGVDNDPVIANSQDGSGVNNANFASPPDGQVGIMRMFTFTTTTPNRDGSLENDVVAHEMTHGLSNRLTGGPANANCLQTLEAGGMGEGWSDTFALMVSLPDDATRATDLITGGYVLNNAAGVRNFPFSTNLATNPLTFASLNKLNEVHNIGEVWTAMLHEVMWNMIDVSGKTPSSKIVSSACTNTGNTDLMLLLIAGMKMQPCNPTFIQAKNAIIAAEAAMFKGKYACAIANGMAKRGLGVNAVSAGDPGSGQFTANQDLPAGCTKSF
ncbi:Fungalysin metallopeptidase-domain-containing protein [Obelidium mucronatum]|nr:Fungalysin metallopeptidase-domain-containing protein [Obelidium mucronatum]